MQTAKIKLPKKKFIKVWIGSYFNHYNQLVLFKEEPIPSKKEHQLIDGIWYDCYDNKHLIIGDMGMETFMELYPDLDISAIQHENGNAKQIEITTLIVAKIQVFYDVLEKEIISINFKDQW